MTELPWSALPSLLAVADTGSVTAAARRLGLSQSALSRQLQDLERHFGSRLLERSRRGTRLTPAGELLAQGGRELLAQAEQLQQRVRGASDSVGGEVRLGCVDSIGIYVLPRVLPAFVRAQPRVRVTVSCHSSPQLVELLLAHRLDVAIATIDHPELASERLYQNPLVLVHPHELPESEVPTTLADLVAKPVITFAAGLTVRRLIDDACLRLGLRFQPVMELANVEVIKAMVRSGLGFGIIPDGCLPYNELAARPIPECPVARTIRLLYSRRPASAAVTRLIEHLRLLRRP
ncbi:MAG: LysR family transcriptional regulator [Planctomycetota bacterium]|nr:LysR family transcriptional regulator [Planctomycetota bacterium]MCX8040470.1 LysR family transcriptional regulator [Planctomycetota bacterium]MDW8373218.1 LysR family transcriptional regulator [Planctomycetota bacterium]